MHHAFGTRYNGISNRAISSGDNPSSVIRCTRAHAHILAPRQVHGNNVFVVNNEVDINKPPIIEADGLITSRSNIELAIITADCLPIFLYSPNKKVVGAFHAGWRGTVSKIALHGIQTMCITFGIEPKDIFAALGPCIGSCCLEIGKEVYETISQAGMGASVVQKAGKYFFDLAGANRSQLISAGCLNISESHLCTKCAEDRFYSYRREGKAAGRMVNIIGLV